MAIVEFIPKLWTETILRNAVRKSVFMDICNREYEGKVKKMGDTVNILTGGSPTIKEITLENANTGKIDGPEHVDGGSVSLLINKMFYYNYEIGQIERAQSSADLLDFYTRETSEKMASKIDQTVAKEVKDSAVEALFETPIIARPKETSVSGEMSVLDIIDKAIVNRRKADISSATKLVLIASPDFVNMVKKEIMLKDTDNSKMMLHGEVGMYGNVIIKESNNVHYENDGTENIMMTTTRAIALANPLDYIEAYKPHDTFTDAVKGYSLFGSKVIRPKEVLRIPVKY